MKLIGRKLNEFVGKDHTIDGKKLRGCIGHGDKDNCSLLFIDLDSEGLSGFKAVYAAGVWLDWDETITSLYDEFHKVEETA
jgi:hypothetical protein